MIYSRVFDIREDNFSNTDSRITKIHTLIQSFFSASLERGENVSVIRRKLQICVSKLDDDDRDPVCAMCLMIQDSL